MEFGNRKLATSAAILAGTLSLTGCASTNYSSANEKSHAPIISPNSMVLHYTAGSGDITFSCDGANLRVISSNQMHTEVYLNDPACADGQFTIDDIQKK